MHLEQEKKEDIDIQRQKNNNTSGGGIYIGEIGGTIDANMIYTNKLRKDIAEARKMWNPFTK